MLLVTKMCGKYFLQFVNSYGLIFVAYTFAASVNFATRLWEIILQQLQ